MSTAKGKAFVLSVALTPPAALAVLSILSRESLLSVFSRPIFYILCLIPWFFFVKNITYPYLTSPLRHLPQPPNESFWLGHFLKSNEPPKGDPLRVWLNEIKNDGLIYFRGLLQGFATVILTSPEVLQEFLVTKAYDFEKVPTDRRLLGMFIGKGLIVVEGREHKFQRKLLTPAFSGKHVNDLVPLFWSKAKEFADVIGGHLDIVQSSPADANDTQGRTGVVELNQWASRITLDIIGLACVGRDFGTIYNSDDEIAQQYEKFLTTDYGNVVNILIFVFSTILLPSPVARRWPFSKRIRASADARYRLRQLSRQLLEVKRRDMQTDSEKHIDILSVVMRSGQFSDDGLVDQLLTFLAAGHETTSNALSWTAYLLSMKPEVQSKLRAELQEHFKRDSKLDSTSLDALPYLNAVTSEQLRLYPVVPITGRTAIRDTILVGQVIPKGTMIISSPWAINRSTATWGPDAEEFKPERWLGEKAKSRSPYDILTFLHGPRGCIGQAFSRAELKCLVAAMVMKFEMKMENPNEKIEPAGLITVKPKNGLRLRLREIS